MIVNAQLFVGSAVSTPGDGTLYTSPVNVQTLLKKLIFYNGSGGALVLVVKLGASAVVTKNIADKETYECFPLENMQLVPGGTLVANCSGAGVTADASGLLITQ